MSENNSIKEQERTARILELLEKPMLLLGRGANLGVKGVKRLVLIVLLFGITNTFLFLFALISAIRADIVFNQMPFLLLVLVVGFGLTFFAGYRAYRFAVINALSLVYGGMTPTFRKLSSAIVDKGGDAYDGKREIEDDKLSKSIDVGNILNERFERTPELLRKGIGFILNRLPFMTMLTDLKSEIQGGDRQKASETLYSRMDLFITEKIFGGNNTKWVYWLLSLNIFIQLIIIVLKLS